MQTLSQPASVVPNPVSSAPDHTIVSAMYVGQVLIKSSGDRQKEADKI